MVGNFTKIQTITIDCLRDTESDDDDNNNNNNNNNSDESPSPDWETLTRSLRYLRRKVAIWTEISQPEVEETEEIQGLARAIRGHPMISEFCSEMGLTFANFGPWCSTLATLPCLEHVALRLWEPETEDQRVLVDPEPLTELLRAPALRFVEFDVFSHIHYVMQQLMRYKKDRQSQILLLILAAPFLREGEL
jgi:hypothetical protein